MDRSPTKLGSLSTTEDSTMKVWSLNDSQCKQSVVHAGTVWQVERLEVFFWSSGRGLVDDFFPKIISGIEVKVAEWKNH